MDTSVSLNDETRMRFRLRTLFAGTAIIAVIAYGVYWVQDLYYYQLRDVRAVLNEYPEIDRVWLGTNDDVFFEVENVYFSTKDQPLSTFHCPGIDGASKSDFRKRLVRALEERRSVSLPNYVAEYSFR